VSFVVGARSDSVGKERRIVSFFAPLAKYTEIREGEGVTFPAAGRSSYRSVRSWLVSVVAVTAVGGQQRRKADPLPQ